MKNPFKREEEQDKKKEELINCIRLAQDELNEEIRNYELAIENEYIDYYSYRIKAAQTKYQYLLRIAKREGIRV